MIANSSFCKLKQSRTSIVKKDRRSSCVIEQAHSLETRKKSEHNISCKKLYPAPVLTRKACIFSCQKTLQSATKKATKIKVELGLLKLRQFTKKTTKLAWDNINRAWGLETRIEKSLRTALSQHMPCTRCGSSGLAIASPYSDKNFINQGHSTKISDSSQEHPLRCKANTSELTQHIAFSEQKAFISKRGLTHPNRVYYKFRSQRFLGTLGSSMSTGTEILSLLFSSRVHRAFDLIFLSRNKKNSLTFECSDKNGQRLMTESFTFTEKVLEINSIERKQQGNFTVERRKKSEHTMLVAVKILSSRLDKLFYLRALRAFYALRDSHSR